MFYNKISLQFIWKDSRLHKIVFVLNLVINTGFEIRRSFSSAPD